MLLPGRLDATTLGDLLGTLYRGNVTGVLELNEIAAADGATRHGRVHKIHLLSGLVAGVETELIVAPIGETLAQLGKLDRRAIDVMLYRMALGDPRPAGAILVGMGAVSHDSLMQGLRTQMHARLDAVYRGLTDARVTFRMARPLPKDALRVGTLLPRDFLHGRKRKRDIRVAPREGQQGTTNRPWWSTTSWGTPSAAPRASQSETPPPASGSRPREASPFTGQARTDYAYSGQARPQSDSPPPGQARSQSAPRPNAPPPPPRVPVHPRVAALRTLGLPPDADEVSIRRAFKKLAMELHPDRHSTSPEAVRAYNAARFAEASAAYHLLVA